jgi:transcriptional regulator with XRE-family HTH domain
MSYNPGMRYDVRHPEDLGKAVAEFRTLRGLSQAELAKNVDLNRTYLSHLEQGEVPLYLARYFAVLEELGLSITISDSH